MRQIPKASRAAAPATASKAGAPHPSGSTLALFRALALGWALALGLSQGCGGPRLVTDAIVDTDEYQVSLRRTEVSGQTLARGYAHPATISDVRLAHVLANLEYTDAEGQRSPLIRSVHVYPLAESLNQAITKAGPDDEIAASVISSDKRFGLFNRDRVTSFRLFFAEDVLVLEFFDIERELEPGEGKPGRDRKYTIPSEAPEGTAPFRVLSGVKHTADGRRAVQVAWRDPYFANPVSLSVGGSRFKRRTVIMEAAPSDPEAAESELPIASSPALRDAQIRALDQLDALRRQGLINEAEFQRRRRLILKGDLEAAGYESP